MIAGLIKLLVSGLVATGIYKFYTHKSHRKLYHYENKVPEDTTSLYVSLHINGISMQHEVQNMEEGIGIARGLALELNSTVDILAMPGCWVVYQVSTNKTVLDERNTEV